MDFDDVSVIDNLPERSDRCGPFGDRKRHGAVRKAVECRALSESFPSGRGPQRDGTQP